MFKRKVGKCHQQGRAGTIACQFYFIGARAQEHLSGGALQSKKMKIKKNCYPRGILWFSRLSKVIIHELMSPVNNHDKD